MLYWMCEKSKLQPTGPQLQHAIKRNFGGLDDFDTFEMFKHYIPNIDSKPDLTYIAELVIIVLCCVVSLHTYPCCSNMSFSLPIALLLDS